MARTWYDSDEWDSGPEALGQFLARVRAARRNGEVYAMRKVARLYASGDPTRKEAAFQILAALIEEQEQLARPGTLIRERRAELYRQERRFAESAADCRACIARYHATGNVSGAARMGSPLGRALVQSADPTERAEGEASLRAYYAHHNLKGYRPYDELEPLLTYERPLVRHGDGRHYVAAELVAIAFEAWDEVRTGGPGALAQLDAALFARPPLYGYNAPFLHDELLPELGGYLGNLLTRHYGGAWRHTAPLARSRVALGRELHNPFLAAFRAIYHFYPLRYALEITSQAGADDGAGDGVYNKGTSTII